MLGCSWEEGDKRESGRICEVRKKKNEHYSWFRGTAASHRRSLNPEVFSLPFSMQMQLLPLSTSSPLHLHHSLLAVPLLSTAIVSVMSWDAQKQRFKNRESGERERCSRGGGGGIEYIFVKLLYCMPHRCTWGTVATMEQRPAEYHVCLIKNDTLTEVSANKQTMGIIRRPAALHIFKWVGYMQICTSLFKNVPSMLSKYDQPSG